MTNTSYHEKRAADIRARIARKKDNFIQDIVNLVNRFSQEHREDAAEFNAVAEQIAAKVAEQAGAGTADKPQEAVKPPKRRRSK